MRGNVHVSGYVFVPNSPSPFPHRTGPSKTPAAQFKDEFDEEDGHDNEDDNDDNDNDNDNNNKDDNNNFKDNNDNNNYKDNHTDKKRLSEQVCSQLCCPS